MSSFDTRIIYSNNQLGEVICQLRFPEILSIETTLPAAFQDAIRDIFPRYRVTRETAAPQLMGKPGAMQVKPQEQTNNYQFATEDGIWRVNLTSKFISLSTNRYSRWEDFACAQTSCGAFCKEILASRWPSAAFAARSAPKRWRRRRQAE